MKTSLDYLPEYKRTELKLICDLIVKTMEPEMIVLFGSYARNEWKEERYTEGGIVYEYKSDFDILVISKVNLGPSRLNKWRRVQQEVKQLPIQTPVSLIHHGIKDVNGEIRKNSYFFVDIWREGILLYDTKNFELAEPQKLNEKQVQLKAKEDFEHWFKSAGEFFIDFKNAFDRESYNKAAFELHQATERFYSALLLVFTGYRPKTHDIEKLGETAVSINEKFKTVFPRTNDEEKHRFDLLKRAYIDARYTKDYAITKEELEYLSKRVEVLRELVRESCEGRLGK